MGLLTTLTPPDLCSATIAKRSYGWFEMVDGELTRMVFKPWPKIVSVADVWWFGEKRHSEETGDHCWLYFNQPRRCRNFLTLQYVVSNRGTSFKTMWRALAVLDEIAKAKRSDAILCEVSNWRISERVMGRWGWEPHTSDRKRKNFIKRFYGDFSTVRDRWIQDKSRSQSDD